LSETALISQTATAAFLPCTDE